MFTSNACPARCSEPRTAHRTTSVLLITLLSVAPCESIDADLPENESERPRVKLIAHRGGVVDEQRIENSLAAIDEAIRRGYHMLEVDIRESKDGHLVVHHDANFRRFYGDDRNVADLTWEEIKQIRSQVGDHAPIDFAEFAAACAGKIKLMLDTKGPDHASAFFNEMEATLRRHKLLDGAFVIGTEQSRAFFRGKAKTSVDGRSLKAAIARSEDVGRLYFLFEHGDMAAETIEVAAQHGVTVVPSVNVFHYPADKHLARAAADINRLRRLGVTHFQIDSVYEEFCRQSETVAPISARETARFDAPEAVQGVAVGANHFYAIANRSIGKYDRRTGAVVRRWVSTSDLPLTHLNSGVVIDGRLYCAHSNYPAEPEASSVEVWDTSTLEHVDSHSFGIYEGSLTWVDKKDDAWWAVFAHYRRAGRSPSNRRTTLIKFDSNWRRLSGWTFPDTILKRLSPNSCSGGSWGPDGFLYCSGHDRGELYRFSLPRSGSILRHVGTVSLSITGQGVAWDRSTGNQISGIDRPKRQVIVFAISE